MRVALVAALASAAAAPCAAQELGRLFFTPQQRQELDRRRNTNIPEADVVVERSLTVNGHVSRSSGKTTTWINGVPQYDAYGSRSADRVAVDAGDRAVSVKVGQTLDRNRGEVRDELPSGAVKVHPTDRR